jgi:hypothetical protein
MSDSSVFSDDKLNAFIKNGGKFLNVEQMMNTICILAREHKQLEQDNKELTAVCENLKARIWKYECAKGKKIRCKNKELEAIIKDLSKKD